MMAFDSIDLTDNNFEILNKDVVVTDMVFEERVLTSGIILRNDNGTGYGIRPRWGRVYAIGPHQREVSVGQWVLVAHGRWSRGVQITDSNGTWVVRKIDPDDMLCVSDELPTDDTFSTAVHVDKQA